MGDRLVYGDYELRGSPFEVWSDGHSQPGGWPNWYLATEDPEIAAKFGVAVRTVLTGEEFSPPLTEAEIQELGQAVADYYESDPDY